MSGSASSPGPTVRSVCMITGEYPPAVGGVADYTVRLAGALRGQGLHVAVVTTRRGNAEADDAVAVRGRTGVAELARYLSRMRPDVIHLQYQTAAYGMSPAINALPLLLRARGVRVHFITTFHDLRAPYLFPKAGPLRGLANHVLLGASRGSIFVN